MASSIKNGTVALSGGSMDYIRFGRGSRIFIILPGLGDGLRTVKGTALPMAVMYRIFSKDYTVYMFSRKSPLSEGISTREMAKDLKEAMDILGIPKADFMGVSMGGMIAQHFAADYPESVGKLILAVTCAKPNPILSKSLHEWMQLARSGNHTAFTESNLRRMYSDRYFRKNRPMVSFISLLTRPKSYERFFIQAEACLKHDASGRLCTITAPALVIGGEKDIALGAEPSREIASAIPDAVLKMYPEWGHALYEEARDFNATVLDFLNK